MITEDYISFEVAKLLKEKGFNEKCHTAYRKKLVDNKIVDEEELFVSAHLMLTNSELEDKVYRDIVYCSAPTLQMAMKWLREVHKMFIFISTWLRHKDGTIQYYYEIRNLNDKDFETITDFTITEFNSYEKTCEAAIRYCLENLIKTE